MKTLIAATLLALLAGCANMGMQRDSSGGMSTSGSSAASDDYYQKDDIFHSWIN